MVHIHHGTGKSYGSCFADNFTTSRASWLLVIYSKICFSLVHFSDKAPISRNKILRNEMRCGSGTVAFPSLDYNITIECKFNWYVLLTVREHLVSADH